MTSLRFIRDDLGLGGAMGLLDGGSGGEGSSHLDDLEALEQVAALHPDAGLVGDRGCDRGWRPLRQSRG